jgi:hypothetical protein
MSMPTNTFATYETVGQREDLSNLIQIISPVDTMYFSGLSEGGAKAIKVEWQTDALNAVNTSNAALEGDTETAEAVVPTVRLSNLCQIQKKVFSISNTQETVLKAGRRSEKDYQTAKKGKELSKDVEYAFLNGTMATGSDTVARQMTGVLNWIVTNLNFAGSGGSLAANGTVSGGTNQSFTEAIFKTTLQNVFTCGGNPSIMYLTPSLKQTVSSWVQSGNFRTMVEKEKQISAVDVYVSDFGTISIKPHRIIPAATALVLDTQHMGKKGTLRNTHREQLAVVGDSQQWVMRVEHTLRDLHEAANARIVYIQ